ncbi:MAG: M42 family peptidase [Chloroflexi bacterium]|nr:M42 family peptidase [Chloroflexota bacterium]
MTQFTKTTFRIGKKQLGLLEVLTNTNGVSGNEQAIREIIRNHVRSYADEIKTDAMGNLLVYKHAAHSPPLKVMIAAHMDEIGFMIVNEEGEGLYAFEAVGGIDERQLQAKCVSVGNTMIPGTISSVPIHLKTEDEHHSSPSTRSMRIDIGPTNKGKIKVGDYAAFATKFFRCGDSIFAKALDNRLGVATLIELIKRVPDHIEFLAAFTVQEEIGLRGARVAAYEFNPDLAIVVDSTPAFDLPRPDGRENTQYNCCLDAGPAIYLSDAGTLSDPRLIRFLTRIARENGIPFQYRQPGGGGTDAGAIHKTRSGIPSISVSIPGRYAHTPVMLARKKDWENTVLLLEKTLETISPAVLVEDRT